jgi:sterol desaturase/sphingolipid hydroxylase (fatty acid hydroxylase superfamily)
MAINWGLLQFGVFLSSFCFLVAAERLWPRRARSIAVVSRWSANLGFMIVNAVAGAIVQFVVPTIVVVQAIHVQAHGYGLLPAIGILGWPAIVLSFAALDLTLYALHVACHRLPLLWRFHRVHHIDLDVDATTAFRAHPAEYVVSQLCKLAVIYALGTPAVAVLAYEIVLNVFAMFSHSNIRLGDRADRVLRYFAVSPDMHRIHHSSHQPETDSNYGVVTPLWDRVFGSYTAFPRVPQTAITLGLDEARGSEAFNLFWLLACPFKSLKRAAIPSPSERAVTTSLHTPA